MQRIIEVRDRYKEKVAAFQAQLAHHNPESETYWDLVASRFPNPRWFGTGSKGLYPDLVTQAIADFNEAPEGTTPWQDYWNCQEETLRNIADFIGADPSEVGIVDNATVGMNYIANGLRVSSGSRAVVTDFEHVAGYKPWERIDPRTDRPVYDVTMAKLPVEDATAASITDALLDVVKADTAAVEFSHVDRYRGFRFPVEDIISLIRSKAPDAFITIDGAQSVGSIPVDVHAIGCDAMVTGFHKWAFGPNGTGCIYVRKDKLDRVSSLLSHSPHTGEVGVNTKLAFSSTINWGIRFALEVGLDFQRAIGQTHIDRRMLALGDRFLEGVKDIPGVIVYSPASSGDRSAIVTIGFDADPSLYGTFRQQAHAAGVYAFPDSVPGRGPSLRIPIHVYNTPAAIDDLLTIIHDIWTR